MLRTRFAGPVGLLLLAACAPGPSGIPASPAPTGDATVVGDVSAAAEAAQPAANAAASPNGVLVMAHGGSDEWNDAAARVAAALGEEVPTALAFGMANPMTLRASLDSLRQAGVERVAVVRMFLSGSSFREQTDWLLGLSDRRPAFFISHGGGEGGGHGGGGGDAHGAHHGPSEHVDPYAPIDHGMAVATHDDGLMDAPEAAPILLDRALELSTDPAGESVLLLGHGMGEDDENDAVLRAMTRAAEPLRDLGFARLKVATLREDWPEARAVAEADILNFARTETEAGRRLLVLPFRLFGFGPYAEVLGGLPYEAGRGLLPSDRIAGWAVRQTRDIFCAQGWTGESDRCPESPVVADQISEAQRIEREDPQHRTAGH